MQKMDAGRETIKSIKKLEYTDDYVYDISIKNMDPFFFANDILVHNTDSRYFTYHPYAVDLAKKDDIQWERDNIINFYDEVCAITNNTFPDFMIHAFNCDRSNGEIIRAGREAVAKKVLLIKKKRYGMLVVDEEGRKYDVDKNHGKLKAVGLEIKRSDTPEYMQEFLKEILLMTLNDYTETDIIERIKEFRKTFREMPPWEKGTPKRVNNLTKYTKQWEKTGQCGVGHVMAAINYNRLRRMHGDQYSMEIVDGMKTIVCKLKPNPLGITSIGIPTDEKRIPGWYKELPFDNDEMEDTIINKKINNLLGVLGWDLSRSESRTTFSDLFDF
jgi:hypothetical protein